MRWARVTRGSISVKNHEKRLPDDYVQGDLVELTNDDFDRLEKAGAIEAADSMEKSEEPQEVTEASDDDREAEHKLGVYAGMTHEKLDQAARKLKVRFPKGATKREKAEALAAAESSS